jgi:hypothetical protein
MQVIIVGEGIAAYAATSRDRLGLGGESRGDAFWLACALVQRPERMRDPCPDGP